MACALVVPQADIRRRDGNACLGSKCDEAAFWGHVCFNLTKAQSVFVSTRLAATGGIWRFRPHL
jgi:hypothetical protein